MQLDLLTFRKLRPSDAKEYRDALQESIDSVALYKWGLYEDFGKGKRRIGIGIATQELDDNNPAQKFVLMAGRRLIAQGYVVLRESTSWVEIGFWVRRQHRRQGIGTHMLNKLTEYAFSKFECEGVYLIHEASNGAIASISSSAGFEIAEVRERQPLFELEKKLIESDHISGFDVHRVLHNPQSKRGVRTKYGVKWSDPQNRPLSQKIQIIPYWHLET